MGKAKKIDDDEVWGERAHEVASTKKESELIEQTTVSHPTSSWTDSFSMDSETAKKFQTLALFGSIAGFAYFLCFKKNDNPVPRRRYGSLGGRDSDNDSDGDGGEDPRERRRMLELSSFGGEGSSQGAYRRGRKADSSTKASD